MSVPSLSKRRIFAFCSTLILIGVAFFLWQQRPQKRPPIHFEQLVLERGPCFGPCPIYTVMIERNGRVRYQASYWHAGAGGKMHEVSVAKYGQMPASSLHALIAAVESPEYAELEASYSLNVTDMSSTDIKISGRGFFTRTHVYAVPCRRDAQADHMYQEMKTDSPPVPDIFCTVEKLVDIGSCARYWGQSTRPLMTSEVPTLPTPLRCKVAP